MSKASDNLILSLRSSIANAVAENTERNLICWFDEVGYADTFDSPIEQMLFLALCTEAIRQGRAMRLVPRAPGYTCRLEAPGGPVFSQRGYTDGVQETNELEDTDHGIRLGAAHSVPYRVVHCFSQLSYGSYRLDFLIVDRTRIACGEAGDRLAIECDGHDYHERTKEQARRDRRRDRALARDGLATLRFTGSEIFADPIGCAVEIFGYFAEQERRRIDEHVVAELAEFNERKKLE